MPGAVGVTVPPVPVGVVECVVSLFVQVYGTAQPAATAGLLLQLPVKVEDEPKEIGITGSVFQGVGVACNWQTGTPP